MSGFFDRLRWKRQERRALQGGLTAWTLGACADSQYPEIFERALALDKGDILGRRKRFWTMLQFLESTRDPKGETAEAGVPFGLSSYLICSYRRLREPGFRGTRHQAIASYRGFARAHPAALHARPDLHLAGVLLPACRARGGNRDRRPGHRGLARLQGGHRRLLQDPRCVCGASALRQLGHLQGRPMWAGAAVAAHLRRW